MKEIKRTISALLVLVMVLGMLPMSVFASEETVPETAPVETAAVTEAAAEETTAPVETQAAEAETEELAETEPVVEAAAEEAETYNASPNQLGTPTDLKWNVLIDEYDNFWIDSPGCLIWKAAEPDEGHVRIKLYRQGQSDPVKVEDWYYDGGMDEFSAYGWRSANTLSAGDLQLQSGTYYFTLQSISDSGNYADSDIVTSGTYSYVMPNASMGTCENVHWEGTTAYWTTDGYIEEGNWYFVECFYHYDENSETVLCGQVFPKGETYAYLGNIIADWGQGYYTFRVRAQSPNIENRVPGAWSEMSETIYVNENGQICDPPPVVNPEPEVPPLFSMTQDELENILAQMKDIPAATELYLNAFVTLERNLDMDQIGLVLQEDGHIVVPNGVTLTINKNLVLEIGAQIIVEDGGKVQANSTVDNKGTVRVIDSGKFQLKNPDDWAGNPIVYEGQAGSSGMTQEELEVAMAAAEGSYLLTQSVTLTSDMETVGCNLVIENGAVLTVPQGITLTVNNPGLYIQPGGKLIVDGKLVQQGIISNKFGLLQVNGTFVKGDENGAIGVHADADTISEVVGIDKKDQFVTVYASGLEDIRIAAGYTEYQYVEVGMPTLELNEELTVPEHMVLIFIGGDGHGAKTHNQTTFGQNAEVNVNGKLIVNSFNAEMSQTLVNNGTINVHGGGELMINSFPSDDYNKEHTQAIVNNGNINVWGQLIHNNGSITNNGELTVHTGSHTFVSETARVRNNGQCNQGFEASTDIRGVWEGNPINVDDGTATDPYLTGYWLWEDENGWYVNYEDGPWEIRGLGSCSHGYAVYFLNLWNEEKGEFEAFPVIPACDNGDFSFTKMKGNYTIHDGQEYADYFCYVEGHGDLHHKDSSITVTHNGETYTIPFLRYSRDFAFYSTSEAKPETLLEGFQTLVSGEENSYYVIQLYPEEDIVKDFRWGIETWGEDYNAMVSDGQLIDFKDLGNGVWKFTVDPEYVELTKQPGGIWKNFNLWFECEYGDFSEIRQDIWVTPAETTDPYLSIVWLDNEENGWFWNTERQPEKLFGMGGATHCYNLYFLNVWNAAKGEYEAKPIIPQGNGEDVFITPLSEMEGEIVLEGEEYGDYFVQTRVGGNLYYDLSRISVNYNGKTLTFPFEVYSREVAFFSQPEAKAEYLLEGHQDLKYGEENVYYVALLQPDHHIAENFKWYVHTWDEDYNQFVSDGQFIDFEQVNKGLWKFTIDPEYVEYTRQPNPNWIWKNFNLVFECDLRHPDGGDGGHWAQDIWINPADASIKDEASLRKQAVEGAEIIAITGDIVLTSDLAIPELFVEIDGGSITVPAGKILTIGEYGKYGTQTQTNYTLSLYNGGSIVVESGATLIIQEFTYVSGGGSILVKEGGKVIFKDNCTCDLDGSVQVLGTAEFGKHPADPERITAVAQVYNSGPLDATVKGIPDENLFLLYNIYSDADLENAVKLHKEKSFARFAFEVYEDVTLKQDLTIGESDFLEAFRGSLTIAEGCKIINNGYIQSYNIEGDVETVTNRGTIENNGEIFLDGGNFRNDGVIDQKEGGSIYIIRDGIFYNNGTVNAYEGSSVTIEAGKWEGNEPVDVAPTSGICGGTLTWEFDPKTGTLTIKGVGEMFDFIISILMKSVNSLNAANPTVPWAAYQSQIKQVILPEGLTNIGNNAFAGCENLTEITIPKTVTAVGSGAFVNCAGLKEVTFQGDAPEVAANAFENVEATITYPQDNATWTEDKMQDFGGALTWAPETGHEYKLGDVNHDGKINAKDATLILQKSVGVLKETAKFCEDCAEVSGDGKLNAKDSTLILQFSVGLRDSFPAQK